MKLFSKISSFSFIFIFLLLSGCKKYEENPLINLRSKNDRIEGSYTIAFYSVNGIDSTKAINDSLNWSGSNPIINFYKDGHDKFVGGAWCSGLWYLSNHKKNLTIKIDTYYHGVGPFLNKYSNDWEVTKLTDHQIHLKINQNSNNYILYLHS